MLIWENGVQVSTDRLPVSDRERDRDCPTVLARIWHAIEVFASRHCQSSLAPCSVMNADEFWLFIRRSQEVTSDPDERLQWLAFHLARSPLARIVDFQVLLNQIRRRSDTYEMWEAADLILDGYCSTDSFWYFQAWLIGPAAYAYPPGSPAPGTAWVPYVVLPPAPTSSTE
ncbi:hypothetical protein GCM10009733_019190 [Nonomuraea maheshkhaliensis]|uniref:DUF4240 domain-containing protein n=1 Tax=Nonomuraea maheshkhaliensis TaxID=419590 RepID=A0ABN2F1J5_9ACTN